MTVNDMSYSTSVHVAASPQQVYDTVRQLERMGEWSPENTGGTWLTGDGSSVGDQFEGVNRVGDREWSAVASVNQATPGEVFAFFTGPAEDPLVQWTYRMASDEGGTTITEEWDVIKLPPTLAKAPPEALVARKAAVQKGMETTLDAIKASIEN
ncbi:MAG: hypothetical protein ACI8TP_004662 [Acidimicrobiales bacterium]|jgi:hypothetical protein